MATLRAGQVVRGTKGVYTIGEKLHRAIWTATDENKRQRIIKTAPPCRLKNESDILHRFSGQGSIRQLVDEVTEPPLLVLEKFDTDLLHESWKGPIQAADLKQVAWYTLEALAALHSAGFVHTDVKPDNLLVNYDDGRGHYSKVALSDNGDSVNLANLAPSDEGHVIGSHIFRSPEAMLNLKWGPATDIWSFGATLISLIWGKGWHIFKPDESEAKIDDPTFPSHVLRRHDRFFGPFPVSYTEIADPESLTILEWVTRMCSKRTPFAFASEKEISRDDRTFICKLMKLDPNDRPSAKELMQDDWFATFRSRNTLTKEKLVTLKISLAQ